MVTYFTETKRRRGLDASLFLETQAQAETPPKTAPALLQMDGPIFHTEAPGSSQGLPVMPPSPVPATRQILDEVVDRDTVGIHTGQVKWFNDKLGYGFITLCGPTDSVFSMEDDTPVTLDGGRDVFVHHSGVRPVNSNFHSLRKGEYTSFNMMHGQNGPQAIDVTGIGGGTLMCDVAPLRRSVVPSYTFAQGHGHGFACAHGFGHRHGPPIMFSPSSQGQAHGGWPWEQGQPHNPYGFTEQPGAPMVWRWR